MSARTPQQSVADILSRIERARRHIEGESFEEFCENETLQDAVVFALLASSEAQYRLYTYWRPLSDAFEARHPEIPWKEFRNISNRYRHGYDDINVERLWEDLGPNGIITQVEAAMRRELPLVNDYASMPIAKPKPSLADMLTTPQQIEIFHRSDVFSQSMRRGVTTEEAPTTPFEGKVVWLRDLPGLDVRLALVDVEDRGPYRRIVVDQSYNLAVGNEVAVTPHPDGFELSRKEEPGHRLRPRMT